MFKERRPWKTLVTGTMWLAMGGLTPTYHGIMYDSISVGSREHPTSMSRASLSLRVCPSGVKCIVFWL